MSDAMENMQPDTAQAGLRVTDVPIDSTPSDVVERALAVVLATPAIRDEAVCRGRTLLASAKWCRAEEVAAELVRCYAGRLVP